MGRQFTVSQRCLMAIGAATWLVSLIACGSADEFSENTMLDNSQMQDGIIGGNPSRISDYPSTGAILFTTRDSHGARTGSMLCSGTLIAPDVVLAAAHCNLSLLGMPYKKVWYYFSLSLDVSEFGDRGVELPPQTTGIATVVPHPKFVLDHVSPGLGHGNDIALMYLKKPIYDVLPSSLITAEEVGVLRPGQPVAIAGYGRRHNFEYDNDSGVKYHGITAINRVGRDEMQVSRGDPQPHKCHGDSGGPTFMAIGHKGKPTRLALIGVTSHAFDTSDCLNGGVDTRVDRYLPWIYNDMRRACRDGRRPACYASR